MILNNDEKIKKDTNYLLDNTPLTIKICESFGCRFVKDEPYNIKCILPIKLTTNNYWGKMCVLPVNFITNIGPEIVIFLNVSLFDDENYHKPLTIVRDLRWCLDFLQLHDRYKFYEYELRKNLPPEWK